MAAWSASGAAARATGLLLGGLLTQIWGWQAVFWLNAPIGPILASGVRFFVPLDRTTAADPTSWLTSVLVMTTVGLLVVGASLAESPRGWGAAATVLAVGMVAIAAIILVERRTTRPLFSPAVRGNRNLHIGSVISFVNTATTSSAAILASLLLQHQFAKSPANAGLALLPLGLAVICGAALNSPLAKRVQPLRLAGLGQALIAGGVALMALTGGRELGVSAGVSVAGIGLGLASVAGNDIGTRVPEPLQGLATGMLNTSAQLGTALGTAGFMIVAAVSGAEQKGTIIAWWLAAGLALISALLTCAADRRRHPDTDA